MKPSPDLDVLAVVVPQGVADQIGKLLPEGSLFIRHRLSSDSLKDRERWKGIGYLVGFGFWRAFMRD